MKHDDTDELLDALELRAMEHAAEAAEEQDADELKLLDALAGAEPPSDAAATAAHDVTLGGYIAMHNRVPAFDGADGQPYTVDVDVEETGDPAHPVVAYLVFLRWAETGAGIMDHLESGDIAEGPTEEAARQGVLDLSLYEIKAELDAAIERRRTELQE